MPQKLESARNERNASAEDASHTGPATNPRGGQPAASSPRSSPRLFVGEKESQDVNSTGGPLTPPEGPSSSTVREPRSEEQVAPVSQTNHISEDVDMTNVQPARRRRGPGAGTVAKRYYGKSQGYKIRIDSIVGKRLARLPAQRFPEPRDRSHKHNLKRRGNVEAMLVQVAGEEPTHACKSCRKGHGPWTRCVTLEGSLCGSCANCWYNACGSRCTFHDSKAKYEPTSYRQPPRSNQPEQPPPGSYPPVPSFFPAPGPLASPVVQTFQPGPVPVYAPIPMHTFPPPPAPAFPPAPAPTFPPPPNAMPQVRAPGPYSAFAEHPIISRFNYWNIAGWASEAVEMASTRTLHERSTARVHAAAEELGMRMADHAQQFGDDPITYPSPAPAAPMAQG